MRHAALNLRQRVQTTFHSRIDTNNDNTQITCKDHEMTLIVISVVYDAFKSVSCTVTTNIMYEEVLALYVACELEV